jgi:hypothetical protein
LDAVIDDQRDSRTGDERQVTCTLGSSPVEVLASRILLRTADLERSQRLHRDVLGLAVYREFGDTTNPGVVYFLGAGSLECRGEPTSMTGCHAGHGRWPRRC